MRRLRKDTRNPLAVRRRDLLLGTAATILMAPAAMAQTVTAPQLAAPNGAAPVHPATPIPATASLGQGKDRALVLGGGGEFFIAWLLGFARGLRSAGVSYDLGEVIVGTSAGAIVGSAIAADHLGLLSDDFDFLVPTRAENPSQARARTVAESARDASITTIQSIGRAAMAARNPSIRNLELMIDVLSLGRSWPSSRFHATTNDCYTGERIVLSQASNIPISHAVCASVSLPGVFGPTWIGDRVCMDGAMCQTSTHVDLIAGAKRALVVALTDKGLRFSSIPNDIEQELKYVEAAGTKTLLIAADPDKVNLLSPAEIEPALKAGYDRAVREGDRIKALWA